MAASDARPVPRRNAAFRHYFALRKADGTLVTSWSGADSEVALDGDPFADCTNEATEIGASGAGYIDFTAAEMDADAVVYKLTVTNADALPLVVVLFPEEPGDYRADAVKVGGTDQTGRDLGASVLLSVGTGTGQVDLASGKVPATLAAGDVSGNLPANVVQVAGQAASAAAGVTFPASIGTSTLTAVDVNAEVDAALADIHLDHLFATEYDPASKPGDAAALLNELVESDGGVARFTANALEQAPSGGGGDATAANQDVIIAHLEDIKGATFDDATDSLEALRNRGDAAWTTATGFSTLDAAGVRTALGLAAADLDDQLAALPTAAEIVAEFPTDAESGGIHAFVVEYDRSLDTTDPILAEGDIDAIVAAFGVAGSVSDGSPGASGFSGDSGLSGDDDFYVGAVLAFRSGALDGIARKVTGYTGATRTFAFASAFPAAPADEDQFVILGRID